MHSPLRPCRSVGRDAEAARTPDEPVLWSLGIGLVSGYREHYLGRGPRWRLFLLGKARQFALHDF